MGALRTQLVTCCHCGGSGRVVEFSGAYLREKREEYGLGLREIARSVGISAPYLSDIEHGRRSARQQFGAIERAIHRLKGPKRRERAMVSHV